ncbi:MAG TPA: NADH-quinone oxidoreductase subunit J [Alphaproteobacteria bacterium]|nr:NADH-quinone oxidoreductase subunit J [Alphaproteobacteria bacterium]
MIVAAIAFYLFAAVMVAAGVMVVAARNPVHSVLFLILAFFNSAGLFVLLGAEFIAMVLVIVYVGAVAVLFLFVVMMLDVDFAELRAGFARYLPLGGLLGLVLLIELIFVLTSGAFDVSVAAQGLAPAPDAGAIHNTEALGNLLYTRYVYLFEAAGVILLVAMIGAIVLTLRQRPGVRRQRVGEQVGRSVAQSVELKDVRPGEGA